MLMALDTPASLTPFSLVTFTSSPFPPCHGRATLAFPVASNFSDVQTFLPLSIASSRCNFFYLDIQCELWVLLAAFASSFPLLAMQGISLHPRTTPPPPLVRLDPRHVMFFQPWVAEQDSHGLMLSGSTANLALRPQQDRHCFLTGLWFSSCSPHGSCPRPRPSLLCPRAQLFNSQ